jgi:hypothetical protein
MIPERSITVLNLTRYIGDAILAELTKFGKPSRQFYTSQRIFVEFEDPATVDAVATAKILYKGKYLTIERGIIPGEEKGRGRK